MEGGKTEGFSKFLELHLYGLYLCSGPLGPALGWESGAGVGWGVSPGFTTRWAPKAGCCGGLQCWGSGWEVVSNV